MRLWRMTLPCLHLVMAVFDNLQPGISPGNYELFVNSVSRDKVSSLENLTDSLSQTRIGVGIHFSVKQP